MNRQQITGLMRDAGFNDLPEADYWYPSFRRFAALVAAAEREACAELCEMLDVKNPQGKSWDEGTIDCANAIRARGQA